MTKTIVFSFNGKEYSLDVKNRIHFSEVEDIINGIVSGIFDGGVFAPYRYNYFFWYLVMSYYSNMDLNAFDTDELHQLFNEDCSFTQKVREVISSAQLDNIERYAEMLIKSKLKKHPLSNIADKISDFLIEVNSVLKNNPEAILDALDSIPDETKDKLEKLCETLVNTKG